MHGKATARLLHQVAHVALQINFGRHAVVINVHGGARVAFVKLNRHKVNGVAVLGQEHRIDIGAKIGKVGVPGSIVVIVRQIDGPRKARSVDIQVGLGRRHADTVPISFGQSTNLTHLVETFDGKHIGRTVQIVVTFQIPIQPVKDVAGGLFPCVVPNLGRQVGIQVRSVPTAKGYQVDRVRVSFLVELLNDGLNAIEIQRVVFDAGRRIVIVAIAVNFHKGPNHHVDAISNGLEYSPFALVVGIAIGGVRNQEFGWQ
mmetsp:Transcript_2714/g.7562  ORF Transcript_2714/g.7562 Transcript_2714/m.7562 type:complete len:258 (-) Transcript_2714:247-1020(-)